MNSLIDFIDTVYLKEETPNGKRAFLSLLISQLEERKIRAESEAREEELIAKAREGVYDGEEFTPEEIQLAVESMRAQKQRRELWPKK